MPNWGLVATVKAPAEEVLAFVAYHLSLGAAQIWLYFDDPKDPAFDRVARLPKVTATRCTSWYWLLRRGRDERIITRQIRNARDAQQKCKLDWLGHVDVDEFLHAPRPIADILAEVPPDIPNLLMEPFEAIHDPGLADDIFTAHTFRGPLTGTSAKLQDAVFGPHAPVLAKGNLSHTIGKSFCRPRAPGINLSLHDVFLNRTRLGRGFHPDLRMLHFHAQDPESWRRALPFRLSPGGAYNHPEEQPLLAYLTGADDAARLAFYSDVMTLTPDKAALLQDHDRLITADLGLRAKVADLLAGRMI